ncbi:thermostable hemolysin [Thiobacillus sp.]|uniref:thermostable hemolysin n=1 Tax=Thiobacillus sp. TaxID=924 RepID=UPI0025DEF5E3|nr:thermostable hemolysin [Thiobacillus sp.]MBT9539748.1 thermostable hemolysin [Thiobacillus sp.]
MSSLTHAPLLPLEIRSSLNALHSFLFPSSQGAKQDASAATKRASRPSFELVEHAGADRAAVESFISQRFAESFGSRIEGFMPRLFSVRNREGEICGAFGLRSASRNLFLEQYLDTPIEKTLAERVGVTVERRLIVEVGHFSGAVPGVVRAMIGLLTERLRREGYEWVVFTGTTSLRNAFCRLGLCPIDIQAATIDRLPVEERAAWGSYYAHGPRVLVGNIAEGYRAMLPPPATDKAQPKEFA